MHAHYCTGEQLQGLGWQLGGGSCNRAEVRSTLEAGENSACRAFWGRPLAGSGRASNLEPRGSPDVEGPRRRAATTFSDRGRKGAPRIRIGLREGGGGRLESVPGVEPGWPIGLLGAAGDAADRSVENRRIGETDSGLAHARLGQLGPRRPPVEGPVPALVGYPLA